MASPAPTLIEPPVIDGIPAQRVKLRIAGALFGTDERAMRYLVKSGKLPAVRLGRTIYVSIADLNGLCVPISNKQAAQEESCAA